MRWGLTPAVSIVTVGAPSPEAAAMIAASGGPSRAIGWDAIDELAASGFARPLVIARALGDVGHGPLERLATILDDFDLEAIVACEADALDAVAAVLMGPRVALLCDPSPGDWAAALALAAHRTPAPAGVREGGDDAERLARLNAEVARIAALPAGLVEPPAPAAASVDDRRRGYGAEPVSEPVDAVTTGAAVRAAIRARRMRAHFFDARLLEDPGWDMLLDLFAAELEEEQVSVSSLCIAAGVAPTTALRWITRMVDAGLFVRAADPQDRRRAFLGLSGPASAAMRGYAAAVARAGLPVV